MNNVGKSDTSTFVQKQKVEIFVSDIEALFNFHDFFLSYFHYLPIIPNDP